MRKLFFLIVLTILFSGGLCAQVVTSEPAFPTESGEVKVIFDLSQLSGGLSSYSGTDIYAHTGVITTASSSGADWKYATTWLNNTPKYKLTSLGNKKWQLNITPDIRTFYGIPAGVTVTKLAFVLRNTTGSVEGKDGGKDIFLPVYSSALNVVFTSPESNRTVTKGTSLTFTATSSVATDMKLLLNGASVATASGTTTINYTHTFTQEGLSRMIVEAGTLPSVVRDTVDIFVPKDQVIATRPTGVQLGINYPNNTTATLVLYAPGKSSVYALGDFNDWNLSNEYMLNKDGDYWWITLSGLTPGREYSFQYLVDGNLRIADPYADKILDPWNDSYIPSEIYPNLKPYPAGKTTGIVSVLQTGQTPYAWMTTNYTPPAKDKLVIYELHVRDFTAKHSFDAVGEKLNYLQSLGVNAIELMPVNEFEGNSSWGYNPSFYFAVDKYYGTKEAYKALIDACHSRGIAVIMDLVLNHSYGQSPFVQLYWDSANSHPASNNPWYNMTSPNTAYSWGYDFNHESPQTQVLVDSITSYWMSEYKIDGFRFDFTKGFTNTPGDGQAYDASRIAILNRMAGQMWRRNPNAYVILEHLTDNSEERVLADNGIMLWGNMNHAYTQANMGFIPESDLSWGVYSTRGWSQPSLVSYMESHDEERMMYKALKYGNTQGSYSVKNLNTALDRAKMCTAFFLLQPGSKMIWQFGELGYDYSINTAKDGVTIDNSHRTDEKPIRWDYYDAPERKSLYDTYALLATLKKKYPIFSSTDVSYSIKDLIGRSIVWRSTGMNAFIVGNFGMGSFPVSATLPKAGAWYNVLTGLTENFPTTTFSMNLAPGEFRLYTDQPVSSITPSVNMTETPLSFDNNKVWNKGENDLSVKIYDLAGQLLAHKILSASESFDVSTLQKGMYLLQASEKGSQFSIKILKR